MESEKAFNIFPWEHRKNEQSGKALAQGKDRRVRDIVER